MSSGPVFRAVALGGRVLGRALTPEWLSRVVKKLARRAGLDTKGLAGHDLPVLLANRMAQIHAPSEPPAPP
jgi:hypothetical protein